MLSIWYHSLDKTLQFIHQSIVSCISNYTFFLFSESAFAGAVVTANPLATKVGMDILKEEVMSLTQGRNSIRARPS